MGKDGRLTKEELLNRYPPPSEMLDKLFTGLIGALANPAYKYTTGDTPDYRDVLSALTGSEKRDWGDVIKEVFPKIQKKLPENVHLNPRMAGTWGGVLNMLLDPTNLVPGAGMAGEIKNVRHVSPHKFDKFLGEHVGSGQGTASFGHGKGGYWTEADAVVDNYINEFRGTKIFDVTPVERANALFYSELQNSVFDDAITVGRNNTKYTREKFIEDYAAGKIDNSEFSPEVWDRAMKFISPVYEYAGTIAKGRPHNMVDWGGRGQYLDNIVYKFYSVSQDRPRLRRALQEWEDNKKSRSTFGHFYNTVSDYIGDDETSKLLKSWGIDGIQYPSGTLSGITDSPHKNYVVFDDADITIEKRTPR